MDDAEVPRLFVYPDHVILRLDGISYKFYNDMWEAMHQYVKDMRAGLVSGTVTVNSLPTFKWEDPKL